MSMTDGAGWLRNYVEDGSGDAFAKLVAAYFDLVYCAALRRVGDAHGQRTAEKKPCADRPTDGDHAELVARELARELLPLLDA